MSDTRPLSKGSPSVRDVGFYAMRAPLMPMDALMAWSEGLRAASASEGELEDALAHDRRLLRERLVRWVSDPLVREALFIASPSLEESLHVWLEAPNSEGGLKVERTLVRYLGRMTGRATPFGLFASHAVGHFGAKARLDLGGRSSLRRHTRLDMDYVHGLVTAVSQAPEVARALSYATNSSIYRAADELRYLEMRVKDRKRSYQLITVEPTPYLEAVLARARHGATLDELAAVLVTEADVSREEALEYLESLVQAQLVVPTWCPPLTGPEPMKALVAQGRDVPVLAPIIERLAAVGEQLARIDAGPLGQPPSTYREVAHSLESLPAPVELPRLFQVDMFRPAGQTQLPRRVLDEVLRGVEKLRSIITSIPQQKHPLESFRERFRERYEGRSVPLLEALDAEQGIGYATSLLPGSGTSPLLAGMRFPPSPGGDESRWAPRWAYLLGRLHEVWRTQATELELTARDLEALKVKSPIPLADSFGVAGTLLAKSAQDVDEGRFRFLLENVHGPSGALYLGRFCHGDEVLEQCVKRYLREEEALQPEAVFAEIVHLPQERMGNIMCRPALRPRDIVFLGQSGVEPEQRIELSDLRVSLEGSRIVLRSERLGREVIPRLTNAHNYSGPGLNVYRFLAHLQGQERIGFRFQWGPLAESPFLPRVVCGHLVLSAAYWVLSEPTLAEWRELRGAQAFQAVQRFRQQARLPRWVVLKDSDNQLPLDLDNVLSVETLVQLVKKRSMAVLEELLPSPDDLCVEGEGGRYPNEIIIPLLRVPEPQTETSPVPAVSPVPATAPARAPLVRTFPPGSEWLYIKLYAGSATLDRVMRTVLPGAMKAAQATGGMDSWFFIRYADPEPHLRLRLHGTPERLLQAWAPIREACAHVLETGGGWRIQLDTYEREVERYGGPAGIELIEALFAADSEAALEIVQTFPGNSELRWKVALAGMDVLLDDLGLSLEQRSSLAQRLRADFGVEFNAGKSFEVQLGDAYRREGRTLESMLQRAPGPWDAAWDILRRRGERLKPVIAALRSAEQRGELNPSLEGMAGSLLHMHANRVLVIDHRAQELVIYDYLARIYRSRLARLRKGS